VITVDKYELVERYEALGEESDFLEAKRLFEADLPGQQDAIFFRQYGYLLECHGRRAIRRALQQYERSIALDPDAEKVRYQWLSVKTALFESDDAIAVQKKRVADSPGNARELRLLATAYLLARDFDSAAEVIAAGLELAPDDPGLLGNRGEVKAAKGDPEGALADWRRAHELDPEDLSPVYSSAFLLEREGRLAEATEAWRYIVDWNVARGDELTAVWPREELERVRALLADGAS
jgi:tetratricopeptide (TPR) repeat protein